MSQTDETQNNSGLVSGTSTGQSEIKKTTADEIKSQSEPEKKKDDSDKDDQEGGAFSFTDIENLDFKMTPERNQEVMRLRQILKSPFMNVPLLIVQNQEDVFPVLNLYSQAEMKQGRKASFFAVISSDFGMNDGDSDMSYDVQKKMDTGSGILEYGDNDHQTPVYCDFGDYMNYDVLNRFSSCFLKKGMPAVLVVRENELEGVQEEIERDKCLSGGLEEPIVPYSVRGFARCVQLKIHPMTDREKGIYLDHYLTRMIFDHDLFLAQANCRYFIKKAINQFKPEDVFFKSFEIMNQVIVETREKGDTLIARPTITEAFKKIAPVHNRTKALANMDSALKEKIFGQEKAIETAYEIILSGLDDDKRIKPTVLGFFGPSGVGKTALAEEISLAMNGTSVSAINMSEYADEFKVSILTGSSKGYVDSDEDGMLAKIVKENPQAVILLDEFEKAHPKIQRMFLGIFDKGSLNDNHAGPIDMSQTTIILTSNAGVSSEKQVGFGAPTEVEYKADENLIKDAFPPELLGRIDGKILFQPLSEKALGKIVQKFMNQFQGRFEKLGVQVELSPVARQELIQKAKDPMTGARPLLTLIRQKIKTPIEIAILKKKIKKGSRIIIQNVEDKKMQIIPMWRKKEQGRAL